MFYTNSIYVPYFLFASGDLVIINDRFGVRINDVSPSTDVSESSDVSNDVNGTENAENADEDFDYSDFEVEESEG